MLSGILSNDLTRGYESYEEEIVYAVDGEPVQDLAHLSWLLDNGSSKLVAIMMERRTTILVLDRAESQRLTPQVLKRYQIAADRSPELIVASEEGSPEESSTPASLGRSSK